MRVQRRSRIETLHLTIAYGTILGYTAEHFKSEKDWEVRRMLEFSRAIKCPNINSQLAGFKKVSDKEFFAQLPRNIPVTTRCSFFIQVQQVLAAPGVLERFIKNK
jgi:hypothetical protein